MLSILEIEKQIAELRSGFDPESPFYGAVDFDCKGGFRTLSIKERKQVQEAMDEKTYKLVFGRMKGE